MQQDNNYMTVDLWKLAEGLLKRAWMIAISMLICGAIAFSSAAFFITPLYEARIMFYVNNSSFSMGSTSFAISSSEISAAKSLVDTYLVILKTRSTLNDVISVGGIDRTYSKLYKMIEADAVNNTEIFSVAITSDDPREAEHIANTIGQVLPEKIASIVDGSSVRIVDYAVVPSQKKSPSISKYTMVGILAGLLLSCAVIIVIELLDDQIHSEEYLIQNYERIPLLAVIPDMLDEKGSGYYYSRYGYRGYGYGYGYGYRQHTARQKRSTGAAQGKKPAAPKGREKR